jgi:hypothetical protein
MRIQTSAPMRISAPAGTRYAANLAIMQAINMKKYSNIGGKSKEIIMTAVKN